MRIGQGVLVPVLLSTALLGQDVPWLRPVARFTVPETRVVAADLTADGSLLVTVTTERVVRVFATSPYRRLREFSLPEGVDAEGARIAVDGATLVVPGADGKTALAVSLTDGKPVSPVPDVPTGDAEPPATLRKEVPEARNLRTTRDGKFATFHSLDAYWLWTDELDQQALNTFTTDARLTGDGKFVVVTQTDGVVVLPATGGDAWTVPDLGLGPVAVPFGDASRFVAIDGTCVVVVDASTKKVESRTPIAKLGIAAGRAVALAARPDGTQLVVQWWSSKQGEASGWRLDLEAAKAQRLPCAPQLAQWIHDGFVLLSGRPGVCGRLGDAKWSWLPDGTEGPFAVLQTWPAEVRTMPMGGAAAVPGRREFVYPCDAQDHTSTRLTRIDGGKGAVLATQPVPKPPHPDETRFEWISSPVVVAGHVIATCSDAECTRLELRNLDDLSVIASADLPHGLTGPPRLTAAGHMPRLLLDSRDQLAVYDFVPPADAKK